MSFFILRIIVAMAEPRLPLLPSTAPVTLVKAVGKGAFGYVYLAIDKATKEERALKVIDMKKLSQAPQYLESEVQILEKLSYSAFPYVVRMYGKFKINEHDLGVVMEYCDGGDMREYLLKHQRLDEQTAKKFMNDFALGLIFLESNKIVHRDLKLTNLLLKSKPFDLPILKIADFGFAKEVNEYDEVLTSFVGTKLYLAPEICYGTSRAYTAKSDLWSVGLIFYEMLSGPLHEKRPEFQTIAYQKVVPIAAELRVLYSPSCLSLLERLVKKEPYERISWKEFFAHPWLDIKSNPHHCLLTTPVAPTTPIAHPKSPIPIVSAPIARVENLIKLISAVVKLAKTSDLDPISRLSLYMDALCGLEKAIRFLMGSDVDEVQDLTREIDAGYFCVFR
jgi:serine/threonine-protein kinase ULK3